MITLKTEHAGVSTDGVNDAVREYTARLREVRQSASYDAPESSLNLADDSDFLIDVRGLVAQKVTSHLKYNIVVGIGGSNLGTKAVYDALLGYRDAMESQRFPKLLFAETTDPEWLQSVVKLIGTLEDPSEVLVTVISKSGGTTETLANFEIIAAACVERFENIDDRIVVITDEGSKFWDAAGERGLSRLSLPAQVGGRYSVFSSVGLFPLATVGIQVGDLLAGAQQALDECLHEDGYAARSALILTEQLQQGKTINDNFFFHPELESLGKWYRQLMGESIGKEHDIDGKTVHAGITPTVSLGSTDLHSVGQLYLGGPKDKITTFVSADSSATCPLPTERYLPELVPMIDGKSAADIMDAILEGVKAAYRKAELPYMEVRLDAIDEASIGAYMQFKMIEMMYLGQLLRVNSFDQPNVESYKVETKRILESE